MKTCGMVKLASVMIAIINTIQPINAQQIHEGDAKKGARYFIQCRSCHTLGDTESHGVGPNLSGLLGAKSATKEGFNYSPALKSSGIIWDEKSLDTFIANPMKQVPSTRMAFMGMRDAKKRADLIAFLAEKTAVK